MTGNFQKDLAFGKDAEAKFALRFPELKATSGMKGDFIMPCGSVLETKEDRYCPNKWPNYIMERYRSKEREGGPWQSKEHGAKYFAYNFNKTGMLVLFETEELVIELEKIVIEHKLELQGIGNGTYITRFYRVPRVLLHHINQPLSLLGVENVS
jgi:hypothetical protein